MAETTAKVPVKTQKAMEPSTTLHPFESLQREINRIFDAFRWPVPSGRTVSDLEPFSRTETSWGSMPTADITEKNSAYGVTAELPGMDEEDIEVTFSDGALTIKGKKKEEREEKEKDYHLSERRFGSFQRALRVPQGVDADKISATVKNGVLTALVSKPVLNPANRTT